jgi:hypothetical protein
VFPYLRSVSINFTGNKLKPNTKMYAFFNEYNVTGLCYSSNTTANVVASFGSGELNQSNIITDSTGSVTGVFNFDVSSSGLRIPAGKINFRLTDSDTNDANKESFADAVFNANGTLSKVEPPRVTYVAPVTYNPGNSDVVGGAVEPGESVISSPGFADFAAAHLKGVNINNLNNSDRTKYEDFYKTALAKAQVTETQFQTQLATAPLAASGYRSGVNDVYNFKGSGDYRTATNILEATDSSGGTFLQRLDAVVTDDYRDTVVIPIYEGTKAAVTDAVKNNQVTSDMLAFYQAGLANGSFPVPETTAGVEKAIANYAAALTLAVIEKPISQDYIAAGIANGLRG